MGNNGQHHHHVGILAHSAEGAALSFQTFCREGFARLGPHAHPDVTLDLIPLSRSMPYWESGDYDAVRAILRESAERLAAAGADFFICPDNTAHLAFERDGDPYPIPGLHIAEVVADEAAARGYRKVGILGTRFTMEGPVYPRALAARGIATAVPDAADRTIVDTIIFDELVNGVFTDAGRAAHHRVIEHLAAAGCDGRRPGLHRNPAARHPRDLAAAYSGLHPAAGARRLRRRDRRPPAADMAWRPGQRATQRYRTDLIPAASLSYSNGAL